MYIVYMPLCHYAMNGHAHGRTDQCDDAIGCATIRICCCNALSAVCHEQHTLRQHVTTRPIKTTWLCPQYQHHSDGSEILIRWTHAWHACHVSQVPHNSWVVCCTTIIYSAFVWYMNRTIFINNCADRYGLSLSLSPFKCWFQFILPSVGCLMHDG